MRSLMLTCALLGAGFVAGKLYGSPPKVVMSAKLSETLAGRIVERRLASYVGKSVQHEGSSATIKQIIVPDMAEKRGDHGHARFKAKLSDNEGNEITVELRKLGIFKSFPTPGHVQLINANANELFGDNYSHARLLAKYTDDSGEVFWEALVEFGASHNETKEADPFVVLLSEKEDFAKIVAH